MPEPNDVPPKPDIMALVAAQMNQGFQLAKETSHEEFVEAVNGKKMIYELQLKNQTKIIKRSHLIIFSIYVTMYLLFPVVFISIYTYIHSNPMLLTGLIFSTLGSLLAAKSPKFGFFLTLVLLGW